MDVDYSVGKTDILNFHPSESFLFVSKDLTLLKCCVNFLSVVLFVFSVFVFKSAQFIFDLDCRCESETRVIVVN